MEYNKIMKAEFIEGEGQLEDIKKLSNKTIVIEITLTA